MGQPPSIPVAHKPAENGKFIMFAKDIPLKTRLISVARSSGALQTANKLYKLGNAKPETSPKMKLKDNYKRTKFLKSPAKKKSIALNWDFQIRYYSSL